MIIGSISENLNFEKRVAITPEILKKYKNLGFNICINKNYASHLGFKKEGVEIFENKMEVISRSNIIIQMNLPEEEELKFFKENQTIIGVLNPYINKDKLKNLVEKKINCFSM